MKSTLDTLEGLVRKLNIEVPADEVNRAFSRIYEGIQKDAHIKGFRKGKAPLTKIKSMYKDRVSQDVLQQLLADAYRKAVDEHSLDPVSQPQVDIQTFEEEKDFVFSAELEIRPEVPLNKFEGLEVEKEIFELDEAKVDEILENLRSNFQETTPVLEDRNAQEGDLANINFEGFVDGGPLDNGKAEGHELELGTNTFIPGFEEGVVGMKPGDTKKIEIKFPDNYHVDNLKGKPVSFDVKLNSINKKVLPEVNDDFAAKVNPEFKTLDDLKTAIRDDIEKNETQRIQADLKDRLMKALAEANPFDVPPSLVADQKTRLVQDIEGKLRQQGMDNSAMEEYKSKWGDEFDKTANFMVQTSFLVDALASKNDLRATDKDIDDKVKETAAGMNIDVEKIKEFYNAPERRQSLQYQIMEDKVVAFLLEKAKVKEVAKDKLADTEPKL